MERCALPPGRRAVYPLVVAFIVLLAAAALSVTGTAFDSAKNVSEDSTTQSFAPHIVVSRRAGDDGSILHVVWREVGNDGMARIFYRRSVNGGDTFLPRIRLDEQPSAQLGDPKIATAGDEVIVVYPRSGRLFLRFSGDSGQSFPNDPKPVPGSQNADTVLFDPKYANITNPPQGSAARFSVAWVQNDTVIFVARQTADSLPSNDTFDLVDSFPLGPPRIVALSHQWEPPGSGGGAIPTGGAVGASAQAARRAGIATMTFAYATAPTAATGEVRVLHALDWFDTVTGAQFVQGSPNVNGIDGVFTAFAETDGVLLDTSANQLVSGNAASVHPDALSMVNVGNFIYVAWAQRDGTTGETEVYFDHNRNNANGEPSQPIPDGPDSGTPVPIALQRTNSTFGTDVLLSGNGSGAGDLFRADSRVSMNLSLATNRLLIAWFERRTTADTARIVQRSLPQPTANAQPVALSDSGTFDTRPIPSAWTGAAYPIRDAAQTVKNAVLFTATGATGPPNRDIFLITVRTLDGVGPEVSSATFHDVNKDSAVSEGDTIHVVFSETLTILTPLTLQDFNLPVSGDRFGLSNLDVETFVEIRNAAGAFVAQSVGAQGTVFRLTLTDSPVLTINGTFNSSATGSGSASGIRLASSALSKVQDNEGNAGVAGTGVDVAGTIATDTASSSATLTTTGTGGPHPGASNNPEVVCALERLGLPPGLLGALRGLRDALLGAPAGRGLAAGYYGFGLGLAPVAVLPWVAWGRRRTKPITWMRRTPTRRKEPS